MHQFKKSKIIVLLSGLVLLSWALLTLSRQQWFKENKLLAPVQSVLASGDQFFAKVTNSLSQTTAHIDQLLGAYRENQGLKRRILELEEVEADHQSLKEENDSLRASLELAERHTTYQRISAEVLYRNPSSWSETLALSAGSQSGVHQDMLVMANGGIIGKVSEVTANNSRISLLTDVTKEHDLAVKVNLESGAVYGIITAYDAEENVYIVTQLNNATGLASGQQVVTSDLSEKLPSQLLIGSVESVTKNKNGIETEVKVRPAADFDNIYSVVLVGK